jgi:hypothetical protein
LQAKRWGEDWLLKLMLARAREHETYFEDEDEVLFVKNESKVRRDAAQLNLCVGLGALDQIWLD